MDDVSGYAPPRLENPVTLSKYRELVSNSTDDVGMDDGVKTGGMKGKILATSVNDDGVVFHFCCKKCDDFLANTRIFIESTIF